MLPATSRILLMMLLTLTLAFGTDPSATPFNRSAAGTAAATTTGAARSQEPPSTEVGLGDPAPNFSYQAEDGRWHKLSDLRIHGSVLLVIAPDASGLRAIQDDRERLLDLGVVPVAVADMSPRAARSLARRLRLSFNVLADPRRVIASQFNAVDPHTQAAAPAWFLVDRSGCVRAFDHGSLPAEDLSALVSRGLGLPEPGANQPASH